VKPSEGRGISHIDYEQQEFLVAAALSGDRAMLRAYESGDAYMALATACGAAPPSATKATHREVRDVYKVVVIATLYGMGPAALAHDLGIQPADAEGLIRQICKTYPQYWIWSNNVAQTAKIRRRQTTCLGWQIRYPPIECDDNTRHRELLAKEERTARNWPVQATGAEILRVAILLGGEKGIRICAPAHDAVFVEDSAGAIDGATETMRQCMQLASEIVIGIATRTEATVVEWPDRYRVDKGAPTWEELCKILNLEP
jgi:DNA polymerase I